MKLGEFLKTYFGPAIIIATVVLGPGTIMVSSRVGCEYGYSMSWVLLLAGILMFTAATLSARLESNWTELFARSFPIAWGQ